MIIRSQDKKSITDDLNLYIDDYNQEGYSICNSKMDNLGTYSTEEKAIKVLDMIQEHYDKVIDARYWNDTYQDNYFQMPQDSEV